MEGFENELSEQHLHDGAFGTVEGGQHRVGGQLERVGGAAVVDVVAQARHQQRQRFQFPAKQQQQQNDFVVGR